MFMKRYENMKKILLFCLFLTPLFPVLHADDLEQGDATVSASIIAIQDDILYMTTGSQTNAKEKALYLFNIKNPAQPRLLSKVPLKGFPQDLEVHGNKVILVNAKSVYEIDVTNPVKPEIVSETLVSEDPVYGPGGIELKEDFVYIACRAGGVLIVDIKDTESVVRKTFEGAFLRDTLSLDNVLYAADHMKGIQIYDLDSGDRIFTMPLRNGLAMRMRHDGEKIFLANGSNGLLIFSFFQDGRLEKIGELPSLGRYQAYGTFIFDMAFDAAPAKYAIIAAGETGIAVIDVQDPSKPKLVAVCPELQWTYVKSIAVKNDILYANDDTYGLRVVDISDIENPKLLDTGIKVVK